MSVKFAIKKTYVSGPHAGKEYICTKGGYVRCITDTLLPDDLYTSPQGAAIAMSRFAKYYPEARFEIIKKYFN